MHMKANMGKLDRMIRIVVGIVFLAFALQIVFPGTGWNWVGWIGVVPILTAIMRFCPAYQLIGVRTGL